jgi:processive 1,2-diacylglycerol beta-glucosyltransferase
MKKILVFYGSYGGGHLSAAKSISSYLETTYGNDVEVKVVDCIEYINKYINKVSTEAYKELAKKAPWAWKQVYKNSQNGALSYISNTTNKLMSHKLNSLLQEFQPDLIISTHPFSTQMCAILKKRKKITCKIATILTDYHIHAQWLVLSDFVDYFFVSNDQMKIDMIAEGIEDKKIFVTGIPVSERFSENFNKEEICESFGLSANKPTLLFFAGGEFGLGRNTTYMVLKALIRMYKGLQIVAISGKNKKMNQKFNDLVELTNSSDRVKVIEYTNKVPELMSISMGVITKPGGLTVTECLTSHLPIVIINPIPGQEEENADFLVNNGVAIWIKKDDNIARSLKNLSRDPQKIELMGQKAKELSKPNATADICNILINEFDDIIKVPNKIIVSVLVKCKDKYLFMKQNKKDDSSNGDSVKQDGLQLANSTDQIYLISGSLKNNENLEDGIKRVAFEEANLQLNEVTPFDFDSNTLPYEGRQTQLIYLRYLAEIDEAEASLVISKDNEKEIVWISKDELLNYKCNEQALRFKAIEKILFL